MFPFTQIANFYTYLFYKEVKCQNPTCNIVMTVPKDSNATHCSVGCGYAHHNYECEKLKKEEEEKKKKKEEEFKQLIIDEIYNEEYENIKNELKNKMREEIKNDIRKKLESDLFPYETK